VNKTPVLYGFTFIRNGIKYDYPFVESLTSLTQLCDSSVVIVGDSEDETKEYVEKIDKLVIDDSVWDPNMMGDGGQILSFQTNIALDKVREINGENQDSWAFYLQGDEVIHEDDFNIIKKDIIKASEQGCDAISFRYWHFWLDHNHVAVSERWYPQEVRAIKLNSNIRSFGDAQGFSGVKKTFESNAFIYHYGHVRDKEKREAKQKLLMEMIRPASKLSKYLKREKASFSQTKTLPWFGAHPKVMFERIKKMGDVLNLEERSRVSIVDSEGLLSDDFLKRINAKEVVIVKSQDKNSLSIDKTLFEKVGLIKSPIRKMDSKIAREWDIETQMSLELYLNNISLNGLS
jgi:hypothetical protein